jgi:hypothetical protein
VSLVDRAQFDELASPSRAGSADLYIDANDYRAGARDAEDMYGARPRSGSVAPETDDDLGDLAEPPAAPAYPEFAGEEASAPYMETPPPPPEQVYESGRYNMDFSPPDKWDRSDVHDAAPELEQMRRTPPRVPPVPVAARSGDDDAEEIDLDSALEDLDVDLGGDDPAPKPPPAPTKPAKPAKPRAVTDDGILIDFDDDD